MGYKNILSTIAVCAVFASCVSGGERNEEAVAEAAGCFAAAYFNYDFKTAAGYSTQESERWLRFASSNVVEEDIELLRKQDEGAGYSVEDIDFSTDSTATVTCIVRNYLLRDTLGRPGHMAETGTYVMNVVSCGDKWLVDAGSVALLNK